MNAIISIAVKIARIFLLFFRSVFILGVWSRLELFLWLSSARLLPQPLQTLPRDLRRRIVLDLRRDLLVKVRGRLGLAELLVDLRDLDQRLGHVRRAGLVL